MLLRIMTGRQQQKISEITLKAYRAVECCDFGRVDFRVDNEGNPYVLEVNPLPGLDPKESNLSRMGEACGVSYLDLINGILENALQRYQLISSSRGEAVTKER